MRPASLDRGRIQVGEFPESTPDKGEALVRTERYALCTLDATSSLPVQRPSSDR
jgi:hypothetical protein